METNSLPGRIASAVAAEARALLSDKLDAVVLYGSYARGDYDAESDVDLLVRIDCPAEKLRDYQRSFIALSAALSLEYGVEVSISLADTGTYDRYKRYLPYYENIEREGIRIA